MARKNPSFSSFSTRGHSTLSELTLNSVRHRKRLRLYSVFFPLFTHKRVVKQLSSTHPLFCWLLKSKPSLIRREHHSLTAHRNIHPTPLISFQNPVAYAIYWAVSELLSNFSSWFSKPVSKKGKNLLQCLSIDWVLFLSPFWMWTGRKYLPSHGQRTEWQKYSTLSLWVWKGSRYSQSFPLSEYKSRDSYSRDVEFPHKSFYSSLVFV